MRRRCKFKKKLAWREFIKKLRKATHELKCLIGCNKLLKTRNETPRKSAPRNFNSNQWLTKSRLELNSRRCKTSFRKSWTKPRIPILWLRSKNFHLSIRSQSRWSAHMSTRDLNKAWWPLQLVATNLKKSLQIGPKRQKPVHQRPALPRNSPRPLGPMSCFSSVDAKN